MFFEPGKIHGLLSPILPTHELVCWIIFSEVLVRQCRSLINLVVQIMFNKARFSTVRPSIVIDRDQQVVLFIKAELAAVILRDRFLIFKFLR